MGSAVVGDPAASKPRVLHRGPGWLYVGPLSPSEALEALRVSEALWRLWVTTGRASRW